MDIPIWALILLLIFYAMFEFVNSIFFNFRIFLILEKKYTSAGIFDALTTLLFLTSIIFSALISNGQGSNPIWWFIPLTAIFMGIGNFFAALSVPHLRKLFSKKGKK